MEQFTVLLSSLVTASVLHVYCVQQPRNIQAGVAPIVLAPLVQVQYVQSHPQPTNYQSESSPSLSSSELKLVNVELYN